MNKLKCPVCMKPEKGNVKQSELVMCGRCLMKRANDLVRIEKMEESIDKQDKIEAKTKGEPIKRIRKPIQPTRKTRKCKLCNGNFQPKSNRNEYCKACVKIAKDKSQRERQKKYENKAKTDVLGGVN
jgi:hypothetical protein